MKIIWWMILAILLTATPVESAPIPMTPGLMEAFGEVCQVKIIHGTVDFKPEGAKIDCWGRQGQMVYHIRCLWKLKKGGPDYIWMRHKGTIT